MAPGPAAVDPDRQSRYPGQPRHGGDARRQGRRSPTKRQIPHRRAGRRDGSFGCDRSIHGGASDRKEIDPSNRGSIVLGSVAFYLDRYGYDVLPLALRMLRGEPVPARTTTAHKLITAANVFKEYPPYDMQ